jgi:hypothetical protein
MGGVKQPWVTPAAGQCCANLVDVAAERRQHNDRGMGCAAAVAVGMRPGTEQLPGRTVSGYHQVRRATDKLAGLRIRHVQGQGRSNYPTQILKQVRIILCRDGCSYDERRSRHNSVCCKAQRARNKCAGVSESAHCACSKRTRVLGPSRLLRNSTCNVNQRAGASTIRLNYAAGRFPAEKWKLSVAVRRKNLQRDTQAPGRKNLDSFRFCRARI